MGIFSFCPKVFSPINIGNSQNIVETLMQGNLYGGGAHFVSYLEWPFFSAAYPSGGGIRKSFFAAEESQFF